MAIVSDIAADVERLCCAVICKSELAWVPTACGGRLTFVVHNCRPSAVNARKLLGDSSAKMSGSPGLTGLPRTI